MERRKKDEIAPAGRSGEDRRIIERFSNPRIHGEAKQIQMWVRGMGALILAGAIGNIVKGIISGKAIDITSELFFSVFMVIFSALLFKYAYSVGQYLRNESIQNLEISFERQHEFWKGMGIFAFIFVLVSFLVAL
jgi:hypothetical protein